MKTQKIILITLVLLMFALTSCGRLTNLNVRVEGSGTRITEERNVRGFNRVSLSGFGKVNITQGTTESLTVTTDDNIMPLIETEVKGTTLVLGFSSEGQRKSINPSDGIRFDLVVKDLTRLDISGAGSIKAEKLEVERLEITLSGAGSLEINSLMAEELVSKISGAGNIVVAGEVKGQEVSHSGIGNYHAEELKSDTAVFDISGAGSGTIWVVETLDVEISGLGNIIYYGSPRVIQNVSGLGKLISQGEK